MSDAIDTEHAKSARVDGVVIRDLAVADARYVLTWLLQCHEFKRDYGVTLLPEGIEVLSRRALRLFDAALDADVAAAESIALSNDEVNTVVRNAIG